MSASFWKGQKVLVTGHTGFKGSWLCLMLQSKGAQVTGLALPPPSEPSLFEAARIHELVQHNECDLRDLEGVKSIFKKAQPTVVFHLAAQSLVRPSYTDPLGTLATNVMGTAHVMEASLQTQAAKVFVNVTSDKCYENREWEWGYRENEAMGGSDPYSASKGCAELVANAYRRSFFAARDIRLASVRAGNVIGGGDWALDRLVPDAMRAFTRGQSVPIRMPGSQRPWQHVLEPLSGYMMVAEKAWEDAAYAEGWNFGPRDEDAKSVRHVIDRLVQNWGPGAMWTDESQAKKYPHEARYLKLDCSKARMRLGWTPVLELDQALKFTVDWYRDFHQGQNARDLTLKQISAFEELARQKRNEARNDQ